MHQYYIYILANRKYGTLYIGVTRNLFKRIDEHKHTHINHFTHQHHIHQLVHYEAFSNIHDAITREKQLKHWKRQWKIRLIETENPEWLDLYHSLGCDF